MGKILYTRNGEKGSQNFLAANVIDIRPNKDDNHPYVIVVSASVYVRSEGEESGHYERKTIQLQSWPQNEWNRIERIKKMKLQKGSFIVCTVGNLKEYTPKDGGNSILQGLLFNITYNTAYTIQDGDKEFFLLCGTVRNVHEHKKDGSAEIEVGYNAFDSESQKRHLETYTVMVNDKTFASLKKAGIAKGGSLAAIGTLEDKELTAKRAEFGARVKKDEPAKKS